MRKEHLLQPAISLSARRQPNVSAVASCSLIYVQFRASPGQRIAFYPE